MREREREREERAREGKEESLKTEYLMQEQ